MKRTLMIAAALASLAFAAAPSPSQAATSVGFSVRIGDPYRGGMIRFRSEPDYMVIPGTQVYYVDDYYDRDFYRFGGWYYLVDDGYWYRARSYRGPFIRIDYRSVPRQFTYVPTRYRRHWGSTSTYFRYRSSGSYGDRYQDRTYRTYDRNYGDRYRTRDDRYPTRDDRYRTRDRTWDDRDRTNRTRDRNWDWDRNGDRRDNNTDNRSGRSGRYRDRTRDDNRDNTGDQNGDDQNNDGRRDRGN